MELIANPGVKKETRRILAVDYLRGIVMIIMALDHVRDYFHISAQTADPLDLNTTTPLLFFTRWITHFCAPVFVFLSGVSAYLSGRNKPIKTVSSFLIKRGLWLAVVDIVVMTFILTFNPHYNFIMLTTLWAIGCSMIVLGLVLKLSPKLVLPLGILLFLGHDLSTDFIPQQGGGTGLLKVLFSIYILPVSKTHVIGFFYAILPWTGAMMLGYAFGKYVADRKKLMVAGLSLILLFIALRWINVYGDSAPWHEQRDAGYTILSFINTTKYPASLQFLCMTLGPAMLLLAALQAKRSAFLEVASVYDRVPFFYFVLHFLLAHLLLVLAFFLTGHTANEIVDPAVPFYFRPQHFGFSLPAVYGIWLTVVLIMYYPCKWFFAYKRQHKEWWLHYL